MQNSNGNGDGDDGTLQTLGDTGRPPETRVGDARQARSIFDRLQNADVTRSGRRTMLKGLLDGNPPYNQHDLKAAGLDYKCNINWRGAEAYKDAAVGAFYDLFNEAPTYAAIRLAKHKNYSPEQIIDWSRTVTMHFDWLCRYEPGFDYNMQVSEDDMVVYGRGPLVFEDELSWAPKAILDGQLKVPERTKSSTEYWEYCTIEMEYLCDELWSQIREEKEATTRGWNVSRARQAIIDASPETLKGGMRRQWEWHQQQLKNGSIDYAGGSRTVSVVHLFFREFAKKGETNGKISHVIINIGNTNNAPDTFLFQKIGRYDDWSQCIHPMYYDRGGGGFHHSVTGMGTKMFSVMSLQNRVQCANADRALAPKMVFRPTTSTGVNNFDQQQYGDFCVVNEGYEALQVPTMGFLEEGIAFNREITGYMSSNLSAYRPNAPVKEQGNPVTATEKKLDASKEASLQKTQMNRYYQQLDGLYGEMYRRAAQSGVTNDRAKEFQRRCKEDGVPADCMREVEFVKASRVVGQGSEFLRQQSTEFLFGTVLPMLPENGRGKLIEDVIASRAGQAAVERYYPTKEVSKLPDEQYAWAISQVADMKIGVPAVPTDSQNPMIFAQTFLQAADQAAGSLEQGANPKEVAQFLDLAGQAIAVHLQRMAADPSRKQALDAMTEKWKKLAKVHDDLVAHLQQEQESAQQRQQESQQRMSDDQVDLMLRKEKQDAELGMKQEKLQYGLSEKAIKTRQAMVIKDALAAQTIRQKDRNGNSS